MTDQQTPIEATPRIRERILSIYELMLRPGTLGEYNAAKAALEKLLTKHGLTIEDFVNQEPPKEWVWFKYRNVDEACILTQIAWMVTGVKQSSFRTWHETKRKHERGYNLTKVQAVDFALLYRTYITEFRKAFKKQQAVWKREQKVFYQAFVQANKMFGPDDGETNEREMTPEEARDLARMLMLARGISKADDPRTKAGYLGDGKK